MCRISNTLTTTARARKQNETSITPKPFALVIALNGQIKVVGTREPLFHQEINAQIDQAFANVDLNLKDGGGEGWELVFRLNLYHVPINDSALEAEGVEF